MSSWWPPRCWLGLELVTLTLTLTLTRTLTLTLTVTLSSPAFEGVGGAAAIYIIFAIMLRFGTLNGVLGCVLAFQVDAVIGLSS